VNLQRASVRDWVFEDGSGLSCSAWEPKIWHSMERLVILRGCDADLFLWARLQEAA